MSHPSSFQRRVAPPWGRGQTRYVSTSLLPPRILCLDSNATAPAVVTAAKTRCCATARDRRLAHSEPRPRLRRGIRLPYPAMPAGPRPWPCTSAAGFPCADSPRHMARVPVALWVPARLARLANVLFRLSRRSSSSSSHKMPAITFLVGPDSIRAMWTKGQDGGQDRPRQQPRQRATQAQKKSPRTDGASPRPYRSTAAGKPLTPASLPGLAAMVTSGACNTKSCTATRHGDAFLSAGFALGRPFSASA